MVERVKKRWVEAFLSYGPAELKKCLGTLGIQAGDTILLHSGFRGTNGFKGTPAEVAGTFLDALGPEGNLLMVSLPTTGASYEYLARISVFDVRKTPSRMGLVSEFFRRREGVVRSLHPSHPMLAFGPEASWLVEGHETTLFPCGPGSPFDKAVELGGKVVFFDTGLNKMTFFHWLEHRIRDRVDVPLYQDEPFEVRVVDQDGTQLMVRTYAFSRRIIERRRDTVLHREMWKTGIVRKGKVGNTKIMSVDLKDVIKCVDDMAERGVFFYDLT
jgi:aminoglycoside 3-N-acetyltransferase